MAWNCTKLSTKFLMQNLSNVTGSVLARTQSLAVVYFRTQPRNETNRKIHVNIFTILIVCYGQVKALVGSQVRSVLAFLLTHNVRSTRADSKWNKTFEYSWALFKVEMAASSPSNNSCASQNATGVWNRLKPEEFQQLQEYTKCKIALLCFLNCYWKLLNPPLCL